MTLIERLKFHVSFMEQEGEGLDDISWQYQDGIIISGNEAKYIVQKLEETQSPVPDKVNKAAKLDIKVLQALIYYSQIHTVNGVIDASTMPHEEAWRKAQEWLHKNYKAVDGEYVPNFIIAGAKWQAQQSDAVEFGNWLNETNWAEKETWGKYDPPSMPTTQQLYEIFKKSKQ